MRQEFIGATSRYPLIYVYGTDHPRQAGCLKVGMTHLYSELPADEVPQADIEAAALARIAKQTRTADVVPHMEYAGLALRKDADGGYIPFADHDVHKVLLRSGVKRVSGRAARDAREWFRTDLRTILAAIDAVKEGESFALRSGAGGAIELRPEQAAAAISELTSLTEDIIDYVAIVTHRPVLLTSWGEDFLKSSLPGDGWSFAAAKGIRNEEELRRRGKVIVFISMQDARGSFGDDGFRKNAWFFDADWDLVVTDEAHEGTLTDLARQVYTSLRSPRFLDLSGTPFNLLGAEELDDPELADRFSYDGRYDWTYLDERRRIREYELEHGTQGPYAGLPEMMFRGLDISDVLEDIPAGVTGDVRISRLLEAREDEPGKYRFTHEKAVLTLLRKMAGVEEYSCDPESFPFHDRYRNYFRHTFWLLPSVPAVLAMSELLGRFSSGFAGFRVVCAVGGGEATWSGEKTALEGVRAAIQGCAPGQGTITLSCQMLTTGVTVPEWTGVFMMSGTESPMAYMQAAFRAASPWSSQGGQAKGSAYVFDFAPERMLRMSSAAATLNVREEDDEDGSLREKAARDYLSEVSVMTLKGGSFREVDAAAIFESIHEAYASQVFESGFSSPRLWNQVRLKEYDTSLRELMEALRRLQGGRSGDGKGLVQVNALSDTDRVRLRELNTASSKLSKGEAAEKRKLEAADRKQKKQAAKNRKLINTILTGLISKAPLAVLAIGVDREVALSNFAELLDDESWAAIMPSGIGRVAPEGTPHLAERLAAGNARLYFPDLVQFFNPAVFAIACRKIQEVQRAAGKLPPLSQAVVYLYLFSTLRNLDKETVLTPAYVIERQLAGTLGGLGFIDCERSSSGSQLVRMRDVVSGGISSVPLKTAVGMMDTGTHVPAPVWMSAPEGLEGFWSSPETTILDISAKSGLYPLYAALSLAAGRTGGVDAFQELPVDEQERIWGDVVRRQIFVNGKAPYAVPLVQQILGGPQAVPVSAGCADVLAVSRAIRAAKLSRAQADAIWRHVLSPDDFGMMEEQAMEVLMASKRELRKLADGLAVSAADGRTFTAVLSNPPYQVETESETTRMPPVYQHFFGAARAVSQLVSLVHPSRWMMGGTGEGLAEFREEMLVARNFRSFHDFSSSSFLFRDTGIAGGVCFYLWDSDKPAGDGHFSYDGTASHRSALLAQSGSVSGFLRSPVKREIAARVAALRSLSEKVSPEGFYGRRVKVASDVEALTPTVPAADTLTLFFTGGGALMRKQIDPDVVTRSAKDWRVALSRTASITGGSTERRQDRVFLMAPGEVCTSTFLVGGGFATRAEAENMLRYLKTDFSSFLFAAAATGHTTGRYNYRFIPLVDFTTGEIADKPGVFLDFSSPETLDDQLAAIYGLTDEDRAIMTKGLRPWKDKVDVEADA